MGNIRLHLTLKYKTVKFLVEYRLKLMVEYRAAVIDKK